MPVGPVPATPAPRANEAHLNGRNLRLTTADPRVVLELPYLSADLLDLTPQDPLNLWDFGSYRIKVHAGEVKAGETQVNALLSSMLAQPGAGRVSHVQARLLDGNRLALGARYKLFGIPLPLSFEGQVAVEGPQRLGIQLSSVKVLGLPVGGLLRLLGMDLAKFLPANVPVTGDGNHLTLDLARIDRLQGELKTFEIQAGKLRMVFGGAPEPEVAATRRQNVANYCEVIATGEVELESAVLRDAKLVVIDDTPEDPYTLNKWDTEGHAAFERGQLIMTEDKLRTRFSKGMDGFRMQQLSLAGNDLVIKGEKDVWGIAIPVRFKLAWSATGAGQVKLTPHDVHVLGLGFGESFVLDALKGMEGMRQDGDGVIMDLRKAARVDMPKVKAVTSEPRRIVLEA